MGLRNGRILRDSFSIREQFEYLLIYAGCSSYFSDQYPDQKVPYRDNVEEFLKNKISIAEWNNTFRAPGAISDGEANYSGDFYYAGDNSTADFIAQQVVLNLIDKGESQLQSLVAPYGAGNTHYEKPYHENDLWYLNQRKYLFAVATPALFRNDNKARANACSLLWSGYKASKNKNEILIPRSEDKSLLSTMVKSYRASKTLASSLPIAVEHGHRNRASEIVQTVCMSCHESSRNSMAPDIKFQNHGDVKNWLERIKLRVNDEKNPMPPYGILPKEDRDDLIDYFEKY